MNDYQQYPVHNPSTHAMVPVSPHNRWLVFFLALFFGYFGIHRFVVGKWITGLLMFATGGGFGLWWAFDLLMILIGQFRDSNGYLLNDGTAQRYDRQLTHQQYQPPRQIQPPQPQYQPQYQPPQSAQPQQRPHVYGAPGGADGDVDFVVDDDPLAQKFAELEEEMRRKGQRVE